MNKKDMICIVLPSAVAAAGFLFCYVNAKYQEDFLWNLEKSYNALDTRVSYMELKDKYMSKVD